MIDGPQSAMAHQHNRHGKFCSQIQHIFRFIQGRHHPAGAFNHQKRIMGRQMPHGGGNRLKGNRPAGQPARQMRGAGRRVHIRRQKPAGFRVHRHIRRAQNRINIRRA